MYVSVDKIVSSQRIYGLVTPCNVVTLANIFPFFSAAREIKHDRNNAPTPPTLLPPSPLSFSIASNRFPRAVLANARYFCQVPIVNVILHLEFCHILERDNSDSEKETGHEEIYGKYIYIYREGGGKMERKKGANRNIRRRLVGLE